MAQAMRSTHVAQKQRVVQIFERWIQEMPGGFRVVVTTAME
jgi:hypothetical protein